jgi:hypothetical protein
MNLIDKAKKLTLPDVRSRFLAYRRLHSEWGALHVVLDVHDESVRFCIKWARENGDVEGEALAEILLALSLTQRLKLSRYTGRDVTPNKDAAK